MARTRSIRLLPMWVVLGTLLQALPSDARSKTDVIVLDTGDRITCEIKQLERGVLTITTEYVQDPIAVEWLRVKEVTSSQFFEVELEDGDRYYGAIAADSDAGKMVVMAGVTTDALDYREVVRIAPIEKRFWGGLKGSLDIGVAAAKAHSEQSFNVAASASYRTRKLKYASSVNSFVSARDDAATTQRNDFTFTFDRALKGTWYGATGARLENNNELNLDLRTTVFAGAGRYVVQTNRTLLSWLGGLAGNRERYAGEPDATENLEGLLQLQYQLFVFGRRDTDISATLNVLPGISSWGRVRSNLQAHIRHEIVKDFYWSFNLVGDYDNRPPEGSDGFDWNLSSSVGYTF